MKTSPNTSCKTSRLVTLFFLLILLALVHLFANLFNLRREVLGEVLHEVLGEVLHEVLKNINR